MTTQSKRADALLLLAGAQRLVKQPSMALKPEEVASLMEITEEEFMGRPKRTNREVLEDAFFDSAFSEQTLILETLGTIHRLKGRKEALPAKQLKLESAEDKREST